MEQSNRPEVDPTQVSRLFDRSTEASFVVREIAMRLQERLDLMRLDPAVVLDVGSGAGSDLASLASRYPKAIIVGADRSPRPLAIGVSLAQRVGAWFQPKQTIYPVRADSVRLPFATAAVDLLWSNCMLHWIADAELAIAEWSRVLKPEAALLFSSLGPDSLRQVRDAFAAVDQAPHTLAFTDLHDYGDMLASHGFAQPVMDAERLTLTYHDAKTFWADVRALGGNPLTDRRRGLLSRAAGQRLDAALEAQRNAAGQLELTFEIIYGHAWKGRPTGRSDGLPVVALPTRARS